MPFEKLLFLLALPTNSFAFHLFFLTPALHIPRIFQRIKKLYHFMTPHSTPSDAMLKHKCEPMSKLRKLVFIMI